MEPSFSPFEPGLEVLFEEEEEDEEDAGTICTGPDRTLVVSLQRTVKSTSLVLQGFALSGALIFTAAYHRALGLLMSIRFVFLLLPHLFLQNFWTLRLSAVKRLHAWCGDIAFTSTHRRQ